MNHQESGASNLQNITSNPVPILPKPNPVVSDIMGRLNNHAIDNGDVNIPTSEFTVEFNS